MSQVVESESFVFDHSSLAVPDSDALYEFEDGQVVELPAMEALAAFVAVRLFRILDPFAAANQLGLVVFETVVVLDAARKLGRRPDLAFISFDRWPADRPLPQTG